jgi:hypothetical protein
VVFAGWREASIAPALSQETIMNIAKLALLALTVLGLTACVATSAESGQAAQEGSISEIMLGFWHGIIAPVVLLGEIIEAVSPSILPWSFRVYEAEHTGVLYDVGFFVGLLAGPSLLWTSRRRVARA